MIPLLFSLFLFSAPATPQCNYRLEYSANLRVSFLDAVIDGNELWTATGYGVHVFDRLGESPRLIAYGAVPGITRAIDVRGGIAYAASGTSVYVLRRNAASLEIVRTIEIGATVNDVVATSASLFVASGSGLLRFDRRDPLNPTAVGALPTSSVNVQSLARNAEADLYAADGDSTVERFNLATGATPSGALVALPRSLYVNVAGGRIFVSDGFQTAVFSTSGTALGTMPIGAATVAAHTTNVFFVAGTDRRFRALDLTLTEQPIELYSSDIIPSGGTINRVAALAAADGRLFVAGGDAGLITLDTTGFAAPFALRSHPFGNKTSSVDSAVAVFVGNASGGLTELTRFSSGGLANGRNWGGTQIWTVHDFASDFLLTSTGPTLTYWTIRPGTPTAVSTATMAGGVRAAVLNGSTALVLLDDRSLWTVDLTRESSVPVRSTIAPASFLARSDRGFATAEATSNGTTEVRFYTSLTSAPVVAAVPGATTSIAINDTRVAVFTFRGITIIDFSTASPSETILPQSNTALVRDLAIRGSRLLDVSGTTLRVWDLSQRRVIRTFTLPAEGLSLSLHPDAPVATVLTSDGVVTINYDSAARQPQQVALLAGNEYATKIVTTSTRIFVFDGQSVDVYDTSSSAAPRHTHSIAVAGAIDLAASETALFVLFSSGTVSSYTHAGTHLRSTTIDEGPDAVPLTIFTAGGAPWVSVSRGCLTTGCEEKTLVLDPVSLVRTASLEGGTKDLTVSGAVAHVRVDIPPRSEIRSYAIGDALHPLLIGSRSTEGSAAALAAHRGNVLALGTRLFTYSQPSLVKSGEELNAVPVSMATDIAIDENCAIITGRSAAAELYRWDGAQWVAAGMMPLPGMARGIAQQAGRIIVLTDYSIEIWSRNASPAPPRRRGVR